jgi:hypothetical protein
LSMYMAPWCLQSVPQFAEEAGDPEKGMMEWMVMASKTFGAVQAMCESHGGSLMLNRGPMGGWCMMTQESELIREILRDDINFTPYWSRALHSNMHSNMHLFSTVWVVDSSPVDPKWN